jgi:hypothetical protein
VLTSVFVRLIFDVIGDGDGVQPFAPRFLAAHGRPDITVGENGVDVESRISRSRSRARRECSPAYGRG